MSDRNEDDVIYIGKRNAEGQSHGRGTLKWTDSEARFEGRFSNGTKHGKGCFYFPDGSTLSGNFSFDNLEGLGVYTYPDGSTLEAHYKMGELNGAFVECDRNGEIKAKGNHKNNQRSGFLQVYDDYGGLVMGVVDTDGSLTGSNLAYIYPDHKHALVGEFVDGIMTNAIPAILITHIDEVPPRFEVEKSFFGSLCFDESTSNCISKYPLIPDEYEQAKVYVATSSIKGIGEGLFAKEDLQKAETISFYNGIRLTHEEVDARPWHDNSNTISLDECTVLDVPSKYASVNIYCASLGHKANHSETPNCEYAEFYHPRFGLIKCIKTLEAIAKGAELTCNYGYSHKDPGTGKDDLPQWFLVRNLKNV